MALARTSAFWARPRRLGVCTSELPNLVLLLLQRAVAVSVAKIVRRFTSSCHRLPSCKEALLIPSRRCLPLTDVCIPIVPHSR